jgi:cyclophilin family peptidyl-prolyl cis-trans isomerase
MKQKNFLFFGIVSIVILLGMTFFALRKSPPVVEEEIVEEQKQESLIESTEPTSMEKQITKYDTPPEMQLEEGVNYKALMKTSKGDILLDLFEADAPVTVNNFVFLAREGFYDGVIFHRVINDFMLQGGDPLGNGTGGPGYNFEDEFNDHPLVKGSLAMANAGPGTNGSQFFIVTKEATPWLDGAHTNFGEVVDGMDVVEEIEGAQLGPMDKPVEDIVISTVEIIEE